MRVLGIDPGLQRTGWGIILSEGSSLRYIASGVVKSDPTQTLGERLACIDSALSGVLNLHTIDTAAIEETFVNGNPASALKLGMARGAAMVVPARMGIQVYEYPANTVKKSLVGRGHATKDQMGMMIRTLLPGCGQMGADEADALCIAVCHAHHYNTHKRMGGIMTGSAR